MAKIEFSPKFVLALTRWPLLPLITVLLCLLLTYALGDSLWLQHRIAEIHKDAFTLERSQQALQIAKIVVPAVLALSLGIFIILRKLFADTSKWIWDLSYALLAGLTSSGLLLRLWQCPVASDDAYVDYRYVKNWLTGMFDYNPGQHIMGFTSHLHLVILWLVCTLMQTQLVDFASYYLNCAVEAANTIFLFCIVFKVYGRMLPAFVATLLYAFNMYCCQEVISGKETALVGLVMLTSLWSLKTSRIGLLAWCANALFLLRPEGILSSLIILATALKTQGRTALKSFILPCIITGAWYGFLFLYFGTVLPHGMLAKAKVSLPVALIPSLMLPLESVGTQATNASPSILAPGVGSWIYAVVAVLVFIFAWLRFKEPCWALYRNFALIQLMFLLITRPPYFGWYFCWFTLLGPIMLAQLTSVAWPVSRVDKPLALVLLRVAVCLHVLTYVAIGALFAPYNWLATLRRVVIYREAALVLLEKTHGNGPIAAADVGMVGYIYPGPIIDLFGLVSDESLKYYPIKKDLGVWPQFRYLIPPEAVSAMKPKYLLAPASICDLLLMKDPDFRHNYTDIKDWTKLDMTGTVVHIFVRKEETEKTKKAEEH